TKRTETAESLNQTGAGERWLCPSPAPSFITRSLALDAEVGPTVLGPALLGGVGARRPFLAVGDRRHPVLRDTVGLEVIQRRLGAPIAERQVVFGRAAFVGVALDQHERVGVLLEPRHVAREGVDRVGSQ